MKNQKMLVPLDSSPISIQTVKGLIALKQQITLPLTLLHVLDLERLSSLGFPETNRSDFEKRARQEATQFITAQQALFSAAGIAVEIQVEEGHARDIICKLTNNGAYDLLVIGRNPVSELRDLLLGQVANFVVHKVKCPVLII